MEIHRHALELWTERNSLSLSLAFTLRNKQNHIEDFFSRHKQRKLETDSVSIFENTSWGTLASVNLINS